MTERIRWEDKTPGNGDVYNVASVGYVGTVEEPAFRIYTPDGIHARWLLSIRLTAGSQFRYADDPDELKRAAEDWLEEFVSSLGAIFPEPAFEFEEDAEPLEVRWAAGRRVRYAHADAGYPGEQEHIAASLSLGEVYTIGWADIGQSRTDLNLYRDRKPIGRFNSVFFEPADDETTAATAGKDQPCAH